MKARNLEVRLSVFTATFSTPYPNGNLCMKNGKVVWTTSAGRLSAKRTAPVDID